MQNENLYNNQQNIRENQELIRQNSTECGLIQQDVKDLSRNSNSEKKISQKITIISLPSYQSVEQQFQIIEQQNNTKLSQQQQQVVKQQDSNQKNTQEQNLEENYLTKRIDLSTLKFENQLIENLTETLSETLTLTTIFSCSHCLGSLKSNSITLPCFHQYHQECFYEIVNIFLNQDSKFFYCKCNIRIPYKTLIKLISNNNQIQEELVIQQQAWLISAALTIKYQIPEENRDIKNLKDFIREQIKNNHNKQQYF